MPETEKDAFALPNNGFTAAEYFFIARMHIFFCWWWWWWFKHSALSNGSNTLKSVVKRESGDANLNYAKPVIAAWATPLAARHKKPQSRRASNNANNIYTGKYFYFK
jgi:hypothetical protein